MCNQIAHMFMSVFTKFIRQLDTEYSNEQNKLNYIEIGLEFLFKVQIYGSNFSMCLNASYYLSHPSIPVVLH